MTTNSISPVATPRIRPVRSYHDLLPKRRPRTLKGRLRALDRIIKADARVKAAIEAEAHAAIFGTAKELEKAKKAYERAARARAKAISAA